MQFRKVCNHPELFERHIGKVPFIFRDMTFARTSTFVNASSLTELRTDKSSGIGLVIPKLIFDECYSIHDEMLRKYNILNEIADSRFCEFVNLFKFSKTEFLNLINSDTIITELCLAHYLKDMSVKNKFFSHDYIFSNDKFDLEPYGPWNKFVRTSTRNKPFNIFINSRLYANNEELSFLYQNHNELRYLIPSSIINLKQDYISPLLNVFYINFRNIMFTFLNVYHFLKN
jgi:hypothetical protein